MSDAGSVSSGAYYGAPPVQQRGPLSAARGGDRRAAASSAAPDAKGARSTKSQRGTLSEAIVVLAVVTAGFVIANSWSSTLEETLQTVLPIRQEGNQAARIAVQAAHAVLVTVLMLVLVSVVTRGNYGMLTQVLMNGGAGA